jgi:hypothetical protein
MNRSQESHHECRELEELKRQLGTCNVAPVNTLAFGRRFAEILNKKKQV